MKSPTPTSKKSKAKSGVQRTEPRPVLSLRKKPETPLHHHWRRERDGVQKFLTNLDAMTEVHGHKWVQRMREHYTERLKTLNRNEPK